VSQHISQAALKERPGNLKTKGRYHEHRQIKHTLDFGLKLIIAAEDMSIILSKASNPRKTMQHS